MGELIDLLRFAKGLIEVPLGKPKPGELRWLT